MKKNYVLDTNILMGSPRALFGFADNDVYLPTTVFRELDKHKTDSGERGYNTREVIRMLEELRRSYTTASQGCDHSTGKIGGIPMPNGGTLYILDSEKNAMTGISPDDRIINAVIKLTNEKKDPVIFITNDAAMRFNAFVTSGNGITIQDYKNETIETDECYTGKVEISVNSSFINKLYETKVMDVGNIEKELEDNEFCLYENEYIHFTSNDEKKQSAVAIFQKGKIYLINPDIHTFGGICGKNLSQKCLIHALLQPAEKVPLVIAKGPAGTGKTLLSVACGLDGTYDSESNRKYSEMLLTRANVQSDNDMGFLPGDLEDKMSPLIRPFIDNMEHIFGGKNYDDNLAKQQIEFVREHGIVNICPVGYVRGRTLERKYLIIDEAQNLTVSQVLTLITRAGFGTKVVLIGDPDQIDAKYLDKRNNGLVFASEKMKGSSCCAQIVFEKEESVRSELATEAAKRLTIG